MSQKYTYIKEDGNWFSNNEWQSHCITVCMLGYFVYLFIIFIFIFLSFPVNIKYFIFHIIQSNVIDYYYQTEVCLHLRQISKINKLINKIIFKEIY